MGVLDDAITAYVAAHQNDPDALRTGIQQLRALAIHDNIVNLLPLSFTVGVWHATITQIQAGQTPAGFAVSIWGTVTKSGVSVPLQLPLVFINPPLLVDDPAGAIIRVAQLPAAAGGGTVTRRLREDPVAALRAVLVSTLQAIA